MVDFYDPSEPPSDHPHIGKITTLPLEGDLPKYPKLNDTNGPLPEEVGEQATFKFGLWLKSRQDNPPTSADNKRALGIGGSTERAATMNHVQAIASRPLRCLTSA